MVAPDGSEGREAAVCARCFHDEHQGECTRWVSNLAGGILCGCPGVAVCAFCCFPKDHPWHVEGATASSHTFVQLAPTAPPPAAPSEAREEEVYGTAAEWKRAWEADTASLRARLATAETALADRDRHFMWDDRLRMEREIGDLATRLAEAEAERDRLRDDVRRFGRELAAHRQALAITYSALRRITRGQCDRVTEWQVRDLLDWCDRQGIAAPATETTPPEGT